MLKSINKRINLISSCLNYQHIRRGQMHNFVTKKRVNVDKMPHQYDNNKYFGWGWWFMSWQKWALVQNWIQQINKLKVNENNYGNFSAFSKYITYNQLYSPIL